MLQKLNTPRPELPVPVSVLGVRVDRITQQQVLDYIIERIVTQQQSTLLCQQIITVNPEFVMAAQRNSDFLTCINQAALVVPDGIGIVWAARYLGRPTPERVTGVDTVVALARRCAEAGYRLYLLGAAPGVAEIAASRLQELAPGLQIAGTYAGSPAASEEETILERISNARADILLVAYGAPAQDLWIKRNLSRLPVAIAIGVGGTFDFLAGRQQRAPHWMQRAGLEWLYRLYREPWRWRRMLSLPLFVIQVVLKGRKSL
ncbi:WecB/TagA/CpsF family glycosyltransferase [Tengunoibacter tsumagoiensis]|uniref:WecB/TagA/CpsF family glycosyl transferase n=1 Tax=Tengunoibacter tsumagoiensis TaxID=2014871 RepID=A0A402A5D0_9CHLR|nr:WecB/TagA/CpsF family glycosyltransferase [Tengunoibacter tsumagoiensis]GCE14279.1 WecB/TagA/CpsF family glycosyl transferase [Tengunoibacter tsumagoiensis]